MIDFIKMELNISFPDTVRNLLKWTIHANFVPSMRSTWPQKLLLVLWVKCRRVGLDWIHGGDNKQGFLMKHVIVTQNRVCQLVSKVHSCYRPMRAGERNCKSVWGCIMNKHFWPERYCALWLLGPKWAFIILKLLCLDKEDVVRNPLNKEGKKPRTKTARFSII